MPHVKQQGLTLNIEEEQTVWPFMEPNTVFKASSEEKDGMTY